MKKFLALLLATIMAFAVAGTALADSTTGSITVSNAQKGFTYKIYRILDLDGYNSDNGAYNYSENEKWKTFIESANVDGVYVQKNSDGNFKAVDGANLTQFVKDVKAYADTNSIAADGTNIASADGSITFSNIPLGWYVVDSSMGALCVLNTNDPTVTIQDKNGKPVIDKDIKITSSTWGKANDAGVGDTVHFRIQVTCNVGAEKYVLHDVLDNSFKLKKDTLTVSATETIAATDYTKSFGDATPKTISDSCTFEIAFKQSYLDKLDAADVITVEYDAVLTEAAAVTGEENKTWLTYGDSHSTVEVKTLTYNWNFNIFKYTGKAGADGSTEKLALQGAEFELYANAGCTGDPIKFVKTTDNSNVSYTVCNEGDSTHTHVTKLVSDANGYCKIYGIDSGTYYLKEVKEPAGYNLLDEPVEVVIIGLEDDTNKGKIRTGESDNYEYGNVVEIENVAGGKLPSTGGKGTVLLAAVGGLMVLVAVVFLITRRKMASYAD